MPTLFINAHCATILDSCKAWLVGSGSLAGHDTLVYALELGKTLPNHHVIDSATCDVYVLGRKVGNIKKFVGEWRSYQKVKADNSRIRELRKAGSKVPASLKENLSYGDGGKPIPNSILHLDY